MRVLLAGAVCLVVACSATSPYFRSYGYQLPPETATITTGERIAYEWVAYSDPNYRTAAADLTLCFGFYGPWPDADTLKREFVGTAHDASCPPRCCHLVRHGADDVNSG